MPSNRRDHIIGDIIKEIEQGQNYVHTFALIGAKMPMGRRTFDKYWNLANQTHRERKEALKNELAEIDKQAALDARKRAIMTADARKEFLTQVINGALKVKKPFVIAGKIMEYPSEPDHIDRLKALAELNKMEGDYAPNKTEHSGEIAVKQIIGMKVI